MWEKKYFEFLDREESVTSYESEKIKIPYISNIKSGKIRKYIPDLVVTYVSGNKKMIEIKPLKKINLRTNIKKFDAAKSWCHENGMEFVIITEKELKELKVL